MVADREVCADPIHIPPGRRPSIFGRSPKWIEKIKGNSTKKGIVRIIRVRMCLPSFDKGRHGLAGPKSSPGCVLSSATIVTVALSAFIGHKTGRLGKRLWRTYGLHCCLGLQRGESGLSSTVAAAAGPCLLTGRQQTMTPPCFSALWRGLWATRLFPLSGWVI